jgi:hypothetical protein
VIAELLLVAFEPTHKVAAMLTRLQQPINNDVRTEPVLPAPPDRDAHKNLDFNPPTAWPCCPCRLPSEPRDFKRMTSVARYQVATGQRLAFAAEERRFHKRCVRSVLVLSGYGGKTCVRSVGNYARHSYAQKGPR